MKANLGRSDDEGMPPEDFNYPIFKHIPALVERLKKSNDPIFAGLTYAQPPLVCGDYQARTDCHPTEIAQHRNEINQRRRQGIEYNVTLP